MKCAVETLCLIKGKLGDPTLYAVLLPLFKDSNQNSMHNKILTKIKVTYIHK